MKPQTSHPFSQASCLLSAGPKNPSSAKTYITCGENPQSLMTFFSLPSGEAFSSCHLDNPSDLLRSVGKHLLCAQHTLGTADTE